MKPALYHWSDMARDYFRLCFNDRWHYCRHCRRPVEHTLVPPDDEAPEAAVLTCLDCGLADPAHLHLPPRLG